ncbi:MAG: two-component system sensor histidine kinase NtrB [Wenzhouxiangella sp.]
MNPITLDGLHTGLIRVDAASCVVWANPAAADFFGRSPSNLCGQRLDEIDLSLARWASRVEAGRPSYLAPEAVVGPNRSVADLVFTRFGAEVLIELHPIAARVRRRRLAERADQQQQIHLMARQLAHELRNPLAGVRAAAQLISSQSEQAAIVRHADLIQREVDRLTRLIERFAGEEAPKLAAVNLHQLLEECAELVIAERHGQLRLKRDFDPSIPPLQADGGRLHQLVLNLLRNAVQAEAQQIRLLTRIEHESPLVDQPVRHAVRIEIHDDGRGVPETLRQRLFLPLVSGRDQGSGFGLAIAQQIARAHGGLIEYEALAQGSAFIVRLPLVLALPAQETSVHG